MRMSMSLKSSPSRSLILKELGPHFNAAECKFMGSGREDVDVRMLGEVLCYPHA